jgi:hypothetical protein
MKKYAIIFTVCFFAAACGSKAEKAPDVQEAPQSAVAPAAPAAYSGTVLSTRDASNYTYLEIQGKGAPFWAAIPRSAVKQGDTVELLSPAVMNNFEAKVLGRKFDTIIFAGGVLINGKQPEAAAGKPQAAAENQKQQEKPVDASSHMQAASAADASDVKQAAGGVTIAEILAKPASFKDKKIVLQAKVVKFLPEIMKKNWLHLKDASVADKDIVATSAGQFKVGDVVLIEGTVKTNQDFGFGYKYDVLIEEVKIK